MKLVFLGQTYEASMPAIEASEISETVIFRGQPYTLKQFTVVPRQSSAELTYRGVRYNR